MSRRGSALLLLSCALAGVIPPGYADSTPQLQGVDGLVRAYDSILDARFDRVEAELRRACPPAPEEACEVLAATALWWRILMDPDSRAVDAEFSAAAEKAIADTEAWTARAPKDAEAWFYLGGAYAARVQFRVLRDEKLAAARDGKRILTALERALALDPTIDDAYFGMGMYKYYADVAPRVAKFLRVLLMLPGGDKKVGLAQMLRARAQGRLLAGEADYQLQVIYLWYERQPARALEILDDLRRRYPGNPVFPAEIARIHDEYLHDATASLASWRALLTAAREQRINLPTLAEARSRLAIAQLEDRLHETDEAIAQLEALIALRPQAPFGTLGLAHARLGEALDRLGDRDAALDAYQRATATVSYPDIHGVRATVNARTRKAPDTRTTEAYRLSLEGWRRFERNDFAAAEPALDRALALNSADPVSHYRMGRLLQARKEDRSALQEFEAAIRGARACPPPILGAAYLEAARLHERAGRKEEAISLYRITATLFGAAAETRAVATRALTRLGATDTRAPRR